MSQPWQKQEKALTPLTSTAITGQLTEYRVTTQASDQGEIKIKHDSRDYKQQPLFQVWSGRALNCLEIILKNLKKPGSVRLIRSNRNNKWHIHSAVLLKTSFKISLNYEIGN